MPKNVTTFELIQDGTPDGEQISRDDLEFAMGQEMVKMKRTSSLSNTRLLTEEEINRVRDKFAEDIDFVYEEAIARHVSELNCIFLEEYYFHEYPNLLLDFVCLVCFGQHYELSFKSHFVLPTGCSLCLLYDCLSAWSFADPYGSWLPSCKASSERSFGQNTHPIQNLTA